MKTTLLIVSVLALASVVQAAKPPPKPADFDTNKNGQMDFDEFVRYQLAVRDPKLSEIDTNGDFTVDEGERKAWAEPDWWAVKPVAPVQDISFDSAATTAPRPKSKNWGPKYLRLGKDHESLAKKVDDADPASVGFFRNNLKGEDTWAIEGALGALLPLIDPAQPPSLGNYYVEGFNFVPSVSLNRITGSGDGTLEVADALAFRAGIAVALQSKNSSETLWDYQLITANYRSLGSTEGGKFSSAGEIEWEPMRSRDGDWISINGPFHPPFNNHSIPFEYRLSFAGRTEFGEAGDTGASFAKVGPKFGVVIIPDFLPSLRLFANYTYLWEVEDGINDFDYLETGVRWALDEEEQVFLEAKYRYGQLPAKYSDIDVFQVALSVKF